MRTKWAMVLAVMVFVISSAAMAQDITLTSRDGGLSLSGRLLSYDGAYYRIDTTHGPLTVAADGVNCDGKPCPGRVPPTVTIRMTGEARLAHKILPPLLAGFAAERGTEFVSRVENDRFLADISEPGQDRILARVDFSPAGQEAALEAVRTGEADLVLDYAEAPGLRSRAIAREPLVPIIGNGNRFWTIRGADLVAGLTGEIVNWRDLGGPEAPIVVHGLVASHPLTAAIRAYLGAPLADGPRHADTAALARAVARDPRALALTGYSVVGNTRRPVLTDRCGFSLPVSAIAVKAEDYPLTLPVLMLSPRRRLPLLTREFLDYLATDAAQQVIAEAGLTDRRVGRAPLARNGRRLLNAIRGAGEEFSLPELRRLGVTMDGGERLSFTFRFRDGSSRLDAHSRQNLEDLAHRITAGGFPDQRLTLVGFSDGTGDAQRNLRLSRSRAETVRQALGALAPHLPDTQLPAIEAFGETLPMACDDTAAGR
ncbi:MAG: phosphate ABC transporter substrate-binding/OmpA family protein, partial [Pseudorhodobacter sp.]